MILNFNGGELTARAVESVLRSESAGAAVEVVVVDNASTDGSIELLRGTYPDVRLVQSGTNLGFPEAITWLSPTSATPTTLLC